MNRLKIDRSPIPEIRPMKGSKNLRNVSPRNHKSMIEHTKSNSRAAEKIKVAYLNNTFAEEGASNK